jgi:hypothetical protein
MTVEKIPKSKCMLFKTLSMIKQFAHKIKKTVNSYHELKGAGLYLQVKYF